MEAISNLIKNGLLKDIIISERSYTLNKKINESSKDLLIPIKVDIAKILYDLTYTEMVLGLCRIYDTPHKKYPTRCIKQLYTTIESSNFTIEIKDKKGLFSQLVYFGFYPDIINLLENSSTVDFNKTVITYFETKEINDPIRSSISTVKKIRDKLLAHNEDIQLTTLLPYKSIEVLLGHAKNVISFFGLAYSGIILKPFDDFYLSHDALDWSITYNKFITEKNGG